MAQRPPDHRKIINLYAALGAGLALTLVPMALAAGVSLLFITGVLIAAYVMRGRTESGSLLENHATYIIRTIWVGSLFSMICVIAGSAYMHYNLNFLPLETCANDAAALLTGMTNADMAAMEAFGADLMARMKPCLKGFLTANKTVLYTATVIAAVPILLYFAVRYVRGLSRAVKGYRIAKPLGWF